MLQHTSCTAFDLRGQGSLLAGQLRASIRHGRRRCPASGFLQRRQGFTFQNHKHPCGLGDRQRAKTADGERERPKEWFHRIPPVYAGRGMIQPADAIVCANAGVEVGGKWTGPQAGVGA